MKYNRLTKRDEQGNAVKVKNSRETYVHTILEEAKFDAEILNRLAELEDKIECGELVDVKENHLIAISRASGKSSKQLKTIEILTKYENGMLVELPRIIHPNKVEWNVQYQYPSGVIQYDIFFSQSEAEAKLKEIQNESNI